VRIPREVLKHSQLHQEHNDWLLVNFDQVYGCKLRIERISDLRLADIPQLQS
jgi:hypothetical protein